MSTLKQVLHYPDTNSVEATWVIETQLPDIQVAEVPALYNARGDEVQAHAPAHTIPGGIQETVVKCHSYADVQMSLFRADVAQFGGNIADYESLIKQVESGIKPPEPAPVDPDPVVDDLQIRLALNELGWRVAVEAAVSAADQDTKDWWARAKRFFRQNPLVLGVAAAIGKTSSDLDTLWALAATK